MSYRQAKEIVKQRYPFARLVNTPKRFVGKGPKGWDSIKNEYQVVAGHNPKILFFREPLPVVISGDKPFNTKAKAWIAAAELIKPAPAKPEVESKIIRYPLAEAFFNRDKRAKAKRLAYELNRYRQTRQSLPVN